MTEKAQTKKEMTAREWLFVIAAGVVIAVIGAPAFGSTAVGIGVVVAVVGAFGLGWRLLKDR